MGLVPMGLVQRPMQRMRQPLRLRWRKRGSGCRASTTPRSVPTTTARWSSARGGVLVEFACVALLRGRPDLRTRGIAGRPPAAHRAPQRRRAHAVAAVRLAVMEKRETLAAWSTTPQSVDPQALEQYELRREGHGPRRRPRSRRGLLLQPRDALRYAQRLWADQATGLMLRADVMAADRGRTVLESTAFSEIEIGVKAAARHRAAGAAQARRLPRAAAAAAPHHAGGRRLGAGAAGGGLPAGGLCQTRHGNRRRRRPVLQACSPTG
jgi:hypothetical protein